MPVWQSEDVREADEAVLGVATTEISTHLFLTPIAAIDHWLAVILRRAASALRR